jgi:hypothetical protein
MASRSVSFCADVRYDRHQGMGFIARVSDPRDQRYLGHEVDAGVGRLMDTVQAFCAPRFWQARVRDK